jgi:hypothetical protein
MRHIRSRLLPLIAFLLSAAFFTGCGNPPLSPEQRGAVYAEAFKAFQEIHGHTGGRVIEYTEYILHLRKLENTITKLLGKSKADDEVKKRLDHVCAPYRAAREQWDKYAATNTVVDIMPILREQWKLGWERALDLKSEIAALPAAE